MLIPKSKRIKDKKHMKFISELPCFVCKAQGPSDAHHILRGVVRGTGMKASDDMVIPLCARHHHQIHHSDGNEIRVLGIQDAPTLAKELYSVTGYYDAAMRVLLKWWSA